MKTLHRASAFLASLTLLSACSGNRDEGAPPRVDTRITIDPQASLITVPVEAGLDELSSALDREIPQTLWTIDQAGQTCVAPKSVDLGIAKVKTPKIKCRIVGKVTRGAMRVSGSGKDIRLAIPLHAEVRAEDIGGVIARETATADAMAHAVIRIDLDRDWSPRGTVDIRYDWTDTPHVDFLGQRIDFTEQADAKLKPIAARLERQLPGELGKLALRQEIGKAWNSAFTVLSLNRKNPPVWMRVTPQELQDGGYQVVGNKVKLRLGLKALTETFIGDAPKARPPSPLPLMKPLSGDTGKVSFFVPVIADYRQLEPVLMTALRKRSMRPFAVPGVGPVRAQFHGVTIYGTKGGRIAVGIAFTARGAGEDGEQTRGTVWLTGKPVNAENSRRVSFADLAVSGTTDMTGGDLVLRLANAPGVTEFIAGALEQNFEKDFDELLGKVQRAIANKQAGQFTIDADVTRILTGKLIAAGEGLAMPTWIEGDASVAVK